MHQLVFQAGDTKRSCLAVTLRNQLTQTRLGVIAASMETLKQILQILPQLFAVALQSDTVDSWCFSSFESEPGLPQQLLCANGPKTPGLPLMLTNNASNDVAFRHAQTLGRTNRYKISELLPFIAAGPPTGNSSSQPFCVRFKVRLRPKSYTHPATLDTRRVANAYHDGILTH